MAQHMDAIAKELVKDLGARLWRVREASCHALSALVQASPCGGPIPASPVLPCPACSAPPACTADAARGAQPPC